MRLVDYSYARPSPAQIKAAGYGGVLRYLSPSTAKNLSPSERDGLLAAGLVIGLVWESTATRASQGSAAGMADAQAAEAQADALGYPSSCPIFYAVDFAASPGQVGPYFAGVVGAAHRPVGVYGSASIVEAVPVPWKWQTVAWSQGRVSPQAHIYQIVGQTPIPSTDTNLLLKPVPLWGASAVSQVLAAVPTVSIPTSLPAPAIAAPALAQEDDDMATVISNGSRGVAAIIGGRFVGISDGVSADALRRNDGSPVTDKDFDAIRQALAPVEVVWAAEDPGHTDWPSGFAVGVPGHRYLLLGVEAEVEHWKALAGGVTRTVTAQTLKNLTV